MFKNLSHPGTIILLGFIAMIVFIMAIFLSVDTTSFQLVTDDYYEKEQDYQAQLDAENRAHALGSELQVRIVGDTLMYRLPADMYEDVDSIRLFFYHISETALDRSDVRATDNLQTDTVVYDFIQGRNYELSFEFEYEGESYLTKIKTR